MTSFIIKNLEMIILKYLGTLCFAQSKRNKDKFAPRIRKCLFVGYPFRQKGWKVFDLETHEYFGVGMLCLMKIFFSLKRLYAQVNHKLLPKNIMTQLDCLMKTRCLLIPKLQPQSLGLGRLGSAQGGAQSKFHLQCPSLTQGRKWNWNCRNQVSQIHMHSMELTRARPRTIGSCLVSSQAPESSDNEAMRAQFDTSLDHADTAQSNL